ncbi:MAG: glycosyltransferase [Gammaproteobacteria bacterium]|nr:glycosyltransferase [Gammaproteobacteria bacterium]
MKVAIINKWVSNGGAARAALRLYDALRINGCDVSYVVNENHSNRNDVIVLEKRKSWREDTNEVIQSEYINKFRTEISNTLFSVTYNGADIDACKSVLEADIVNIHWIEYFLSIDALQSLVEMKKPIVWTLHDERAFTGGCHYSSGCEEYVNDSCFECKQLSNDEFRLANKNLLAKKTIFEGADLTIVTPSKWLAKEAGRSALFKNCPIHVIPNSIESDVFYPRDKKLAKTELGFDEDTVVLMVGAENNSEMRKGYQDLLSSLKKCLSNSYFKDMCESGKVLLTLIGYGGEEICNLPIPFKQYGHISDDAQLALIYSASDMYILTSLEDNLPNALLEAMACGTPVIGYDTGGIPDIVKHGVNGIVVERGNVDSLSVSILHLVDNRELREIYSKRAARLITKHYTQEVQAKMYTDLYEEILMAHRDIDTSQSTIDIDAIYIPAAAKSFKMRYDALLDENEKVRKDIERKDSIINNMRKDIDEFEDMKKLHSKYQVLFNEMKELSNVKALKNPRSKYRAYKNVLNSYQRLKEL